MVRDRPVTAILRIRWLKALHVDFKCPHYEIFRQCILLWYSIGRRPYDPPHECQMCKACSAWHT